MKTSSDINSVQAFIDAFDLQPHPEGGWYRETYRGEADNAGRAVSTGIYFLLTSENISKFHRIDADEMWHFYAGDPLTVHMIDPSGNYSTHEIGNDMSAGQVFQAIVPKGVWFGASVEKLGGYALVGCTVAPGFEFDAFELAERDALLSEYPQHEAIIKRLT